jgi:hypothetical protein
MYVLDTFASSAYPAHMFESCRMSHRHASGYLHYLAFATFASIISNLQLACGLVDHSSQTGQSISLPVRSSHRTATSLLRFSVGVRETQCNKECGVTRSVGGGEKGG